MTPLELLVEVVGWGGALLILLAYVLVTVGSLTGRSPLFQAMNLFGALGFVANGWWHNAKPSMTLNIVWAVIASIAWWRIWKRSSSTSAM